MCLFICLWSVLVLILQIAYAVPERGKKPHIFRLKPTIYSSVRVMQLTRAIVIFQYPANSSLDGKKVLLLGVEGPLEVSLQCLLQRKGVMTMSCPWKMQQLQATVNALPN